MGGQTMIIMPANSTGIVFGRLVGQFPGQLGHLLSPGAQRGPWKWLPYALDNGAFSAYVGQTPFDAPAWRDLLVWAATSGVRPSWALVPDVVTDPAATIAAWAQYKGEAQAALPGVPLAFAVQDGHEPKDVPCDAEVIFIGGSTDWKRQNIRRFCASFPRVHVGRINTYKWLRYCADAGAESCDGTGWFRGDQAQLAGLVQFLEEQAGIIGIHKQQVLECCMQNTHAEGTNK